MILVTGTFRSGTSLWMQVLRAAGLPSIGSAYPAYWKEALGDFNPRGFHESRLREGIYWRTNPHPETGAYLFPGDTRRHVVKVFADGLVRTDVAFVDFVVVTLRDWRSFTRSFDALHTRELGWYEANGLTFPGRGEGARPIPYQWWRQNFELVRDIATRRHPARFSTYDRVIRDPEREVHAVLERIGIDDPVRRQAAVAEVVPELRSERPLHQDEGQVDPVDAAAFDALFETVDAGMAIEPPLIALLNEAEVRIRARFASSEAAG